MKKVLFISTYGGFLTSFEMSNIDLYLSFGYEVHCACNFISPNYNKHTDDLKKRNIVLHNVEFVRKPTNIIRLLKNIKVVRKIIRDNSIDVIDSHNAVCGFIARIAGKKEKIKCVIYTPHSFFFYKGCSWKNKILYKNIESLMARRTDLLITINKEDFEAASKMKLRGKAIFVPGVGVNLSKIDEYLPYDKYAFFPKNFNINDRTTIFVSVGEMIKRKNYESILVSLSKIKDEDFVYVIVGLGELESKLKRRCKELCIEDKVYFAGYRNDVINIIKMADSFILASFQEGLSVALMEAMACGKYCIVSKIRGNVDLIANNVNGKLFEPLDVNGLSCCIEDFINLKEEMKVKGLKNKEIIKKYDISNVRKIMEQEYKSLFGMEW